MLSKNAVYVPPLINNQYSIMKITESYDNWNFDVSQSFALFHTFHINIGD